MMERVVTELFRHHLWANEKLLDACDKLSEDQTGASVPGVYGTIGDTLVHLFAAETRYVAAMRNEPRPEELNERKPYPGLAELRKYARITGDELISLAERVTPDQRIRGEMRGVPYDLPISIPLAQAINHGTEHRANITTVMSALGLEAPVLDLWQYARERESDRAQGKR